MDVALIEGRDPSSGVFIHSSGVHGAEGYVGSAIQSAFLNQLRTQPNRTVILIHAVNPFGFAHDRRFNENNVDVNRNGLRNFTDALLRDPNIAGHADFDALFNPNEELGLFEFYVTFYLKALLQIVLHGFTTIKRALVTGQYHKAAGLFYGGNKSEASYIALTDVLSNVSHRPGPVTWVDVHSGLGPEGVITLLTEFDINEDMRTRLPRDSIVEEWKKRGDDAGAVSGYDLSVGHLSEFAHQELNRTVNFVTIEHGTVSGIQIARALVFENYGYSSKRSSQLFWAMHVKNAFYVASTGWRVKSVNDGLVIIDALLDT